MVQKNKHSIIGKGNLVGGGGQNGKEPENRENILSSQGTNLNGRDKT